MIRRQFLKHLTLGAGALSFGLSCREKSNHKPNIILIMADDMGYSDLGCYGSEISTPNLDRLAQDGLRFTRFYNAARCCPTRASLLTGLYPHQAGMGDMVHPKYNSDAYLGHLDDKCVTIASVLKESGYTTLMSGKWHVGEDRPNWPTDRGFDKYFGLISGAANYFDITKGKQRQPHDSIYWEHEGNKAIRHGKWKLVAKEKGSWELYDLETDRSELHDLSDRYPEIKAQLLSKWQEWADAVGVVER